MKKQLQTLLLTTMLIGGSALKAETPYLLNEPVDISSDFRDFTNVYFNADSLSQFDGATATGKLKYKRMVYQTRVAFNNMLAVQRPFKTVEFPDNVYPVNPELPFKIEFISPRSFRIKLETVTAPKPAQEPSLMLVKEPVQEHSWKYTRIKGGYRYQSAYGAIEVSEFPWRISVYDAQGKLLTKPVTIPKTKRRIIPIPRSRLCGGLPTIHKAWQLYFPCNPEKRFSVVGNHLPVLISGDRKSRFGRMMLTEPRIRLNTNRYPSL